jgi:CRP-like cAMP-binding protein
MISPEVLRRYTFFASFTHQELKRLAMIGREQTIPEGQALFAEGGLADEFYFLLDGEIEILIGADEHCQESVPLASVPAGELVGWSALIEPHVFTASARASRPSRVIAFSREDWEPLGADAHLYGLMMRKVAQVIGRRLKDTRVQLLSLSAKPA